MTKLINTFKNILLTFNLLTFIVSGIICLGFAQQVFIGIGMHQELAALLAGGAAAFLIVVAYPATILLDYLITKTAQKFKDVLNYNDKSLELISRRSKAQHKRLKAQRAGIDCLISKLSTLKASQYKNPAFPAELINDIQAELYTLKGLK